MLYIAAQPAPCPQLWDGDEEFGVSQNIDLMGEHTSQTSQKSCWKDFILTLQDNSFEILSLLRIDSWYFLDEMK